MTSAAFVTPGNLGSEFDLGTLVSNKISLVYASSTEIQSGAAVGKFVRPAELKTALGALGYVTSTALTGYVANSRVLNTSAGLTGGGDLTADRTVALDYPTLDARYDVPVFSGATPGAAGLTGRVPMPAAGQQNYLLQADGTWTNNLSLSTLGASKIVFTNSYYPEAVWKATSNGADLKTVQSYISPDGGFSLDFVNDNSTAAYPILSATRTGAAGPTTITLGGGQVTVTPTGLTLPSIASGGATTGQLMSWNGTQWAPTSLAALLAGLPTTLPATAGQPWIDGGVLAIS